MQIIFAGKSHPADYPSKELLHRVYSVATDPQFQGRIALAEDYDMDLSHYLVQGADIWLNNPRRLQEACGTSGMKASLNGALNLSIRDGWWYEGYNGSNGWAIGEEPGKIAGEQDQDDAESLYRLLEQQIVPLFYDRDTSDVPHRWMRLVKEAIHSVMPAFCGRRMVKEYIEQMYRPAYQSVQLMNAMSVTTETADVTWEHRAIREHMNFLSNSLSSLARESSQGAAESTSIKDPITLYRWSLYDFREAIRRHIDLDERIFGLLLGSTAVKEIMGEHETIQKQLDLAIALAENAIYNKLRPAEQGQYASDIGEAVKKICESIGAHIAKEDLLLKQMPKNS